MRHSRAALPDNILDRLLEVERRLDDLVGYAALPNVDGSEEGDTTYIYITQEVVIGEGPGLAVTGTPPEQTVALALDTLLLHHGGIITGEYTTLTLAIAAATAGDTLWIPPGTWAGDVTFPAQVTVHGMSRADTVLSGQIILSDGARGENLSITRTANDASDLRGVLVPTTGTAYLNAVTVSVTQNGGGTGVAIYASSRGGKLELHGGCDIYGSTADIG